MVTSSIAMKEKNRLSVDRIAEAMTLIDPVFLNSPQFHAESLSHQLGCRTIVKVETINPIRSFKGRGTEYFTATLQDTPHLVCATAGNFGQGMAYSARKRELPITIFASRNANPLKIERMRSMGAEIRQEGADFDAAHDAAKIFAANTGARLVEDGHDRAITEGAGTIGLELLRWQEPFDAIVVPLGDGALLAGVARFVKAHHPQTAMIGVCARGASAMERSWRSGNLVEMDSVHTIADGIAVRSPFPEALADLTGLVDDILLVDDDAFVEGMRLAHAELSLLLEPAGAAGLAAVLMNKRRFQGKLIAVIVTGANPSSEQIRLILDRPPRRAFSRSVLYRALAMAN
jgi:threonine dehydratase